MWRIRWMLRLQCAEQLLLECIHFSIICGGKDVCVGIQRFGYGIRILRVKCIGGSFPPAERTVVGNQAYPNVPPFGWRSRTRNVEFMARGQRHDLVFEF